MRERLTYTLKQVEQVLPGLVANLLGVEFSSRSHERQLVAPRRKVYGWVSWRR